MKYNQTDIHPIALALTVAMCFAMLLVRRENAIVPLLVVACFVTHAQRIVIGGLDFSMLRFIILAGWARVLIRGETRLFRSHPIDRLIPVWLAIGAFVYLVGPRGETWGSFVYQLGLTLDAAGTYFLFRSLLAQPTDFRRAIVALGVVSVALALPMINENLTGRNLFSVLGGVPEMTAMRDGRLRCQASFSHPIMAGNFAASSAALLVGLWAAFPRERLRHGAMIVAAVVVTVLSASSGPLIALLYAGIGWAIWPFRRSLRAIRWAVVLLLVVLHFSREKPVWHLIARLSSITGGTGYHRYKLIDEAINHFDEWWFLGTASTAHWSIAQAMDITNQYLIEAVRGGLASLLVFVAILTLSFRTAGRSTQAVLRNPQLARRQAKQLAFISWALGVCLFAHAVAFIAVSYFGQLQTIFYLHLALIPSFAVAIARPVGALRESRLSPTAALAGPYEGGQPA